MTSLSSWIRSKSRREMISFVFGGIAALAMAAWAVFGYINQDKGKIEATYTVCHGDQNIGKMVGHQCPVGAVKLDCAANLGELATRAATAAQRSNHGA